MAIVLLAALSFLIIVSGLASILKQLIDDFCDPESH